MLRQIRPVILCLLGSWPAIGVAQSDVSSFRGRAIPIYGEATNPRHEVNIARLKQGQFAERLARSVQEHVHLRHDLGITFTSCGVPEVSYIAQKSVIVFCLEMFELLTKQAAADPELSGPANQAARQAVLVGAVFGMLLHELGHAVLDINRVPITGREEDVADQFALYYAMKFVEPKGVPVVLPTVWFFRSLVSLPDTTSEAAIRQVMADEHSLSAQRTYNLACWALGANVRTGTPIANYVHLPEKRARQCPNEYARLDDGMRRLFGRYFIVQAP